MKIKKGFTLIELMVVMSVIAILSATLLPSVSGFLDKAKVAKALGMVRTLDVATAAYHNDVGSLPVYEYDYRYEPASVYHYLSMNQGGRWAGPYLKEPLNWDDNLVDGDIDCFVYGNVWDLDRNGAVDGISVFGIWMQSVPANLAYLIDQKIDGIQTGGENWACRGRVMHNCGGGDLNIAIYW